MIVSSSRLAGVTVQRAVTSAIAGLLVLIWTGNTPLARSSDNAETCRKISEAVIKRDVDAVVAAVNPAPSNREEAQNHAQHFIDAIGRILRGQQMRLLQTLPNAKVEGHPVSMQLWSSGEKHEVFLGCLYRLRETQSPQLLIQIDSSADDVLHKLKVSLGSN